MDFVHLTSHLADKTIVLHKYVVYIDSSGAKVFNSQQTGKLIDTPRGSHGTSSQKVTVMDFDEGKTISEVYDAGLEHSPERTARRAAMGEAWADFAT